MLQRELRVLVEHEMEQTSQLAIMLAAGHTYASASRVLGMSPAEVAIAKERIARLVGKWQDE